MMRTINTRSFALPVVVLLMILLVDALWVRLQVWLVGGYLLPAAVLKPLVALASIAAALLLRRPLLRSPATAFSVVFLGGLALNAAALVLVQDLSLRDALVSINAYYWPFVLLPLVLMLADTVPERWFERFLLLVGMPLAAFGLLQFVLQRPILAVSLPDASFVVNSWRFHGTGHVRAFSLFGSGQTFGYLLALLAPFLLLAMYRARGRRRFWFALGLGVVLAAAAATLTRNTYIGTTLAVVAALAYLTSLRRWMWVLPVLYYGVAGLVMAGLVGIGLPGVLEGLLDSTSLRIRMGEWSGLVDRFASASGTAQFFGTGLIQNDQVAPDLRILVDNAYLAVLLQHGWTGLATWTLLMGGLWAYVHRQAVRSRRPGAVALAAVFSTWPIVGLFNVTVAIFGHYALLAILLAGGEHIANARLAASPAATGVRSADDPRPRPVPEARPNV